MFYKAKGKTLGVKIVYEGMFSMSNKVSNGFPHDIVNLNLVAQSTPFKSEFQKWRKKVVRPSVRKRRTCSPNSESNRSWILLLDGLFLQYVHRQYEIGGSVVRFPTPGLNVRPVSVFGCLVIEEDSLSGHRGSLQDSPGTAPGPLQTTLYKIKR